MINRTTFALVQLFALCALTLAACTEDPTAPVNCQEEPAAGSTFNYQDTSYDAHGAVVSGSERNITSTLTSTNAVIAAHTNVCSFTNTDLDCPTSTPEATHVAQLTGGDVSTLLDIFAGNDVYNPGPVWVTLPVASKGTHEEILSDIGNEDDVHWVYKASSEHIGSESLQIGTSSIATEHIMTTLTITSSNTHGSQSFSMTIEWWYAPALHTFGKTILTSTEEGCRTVHQLTSYKIQ
jgi:hypothetical protein